MGALRRCILIASRDGEARAVVEDDFHHFRVIFRHKDGIVTEAKSQSLRTPTVLCAQAGERLQEIVGMPLSRSSAAVHAKTDARQQCTHMIDLAGLAVAAATRGIAARRYEARVSDPVEKQMTATLWRDGDQILEWQIVRGQIESPRPYAGRSIGSGFTGWAQTALGDDDAEAALVLRRAVFIASGRGVNLDAPGSHTGPMGGCWVWQPERADRATRNIGSTHDFTNNPEVLTAEDRDWIAFRDRVEDVRS